MILPDYPFHTYDYSKHGTLLKHCDNPHCSICNDIEKKILEHQILNKLSNSYIKKTLQIFCNRELNFNYKTKTEIYEKLKNKIFRSIHEYIEELNIIFQEKQISINPNFVENIIFETHSMDSYAY